MVDGSLTVRTRFVVFWFLVLGNCCAGLQYQPLEAYTNADDCALILNGPGRTSVFDYTYNLLRGGHTPSTGSHTCITYDAVNRAYYEARKRINVAQPHTDIWKPEELATVGELLLDISTNLAHMYGLSREEVEKGLPLIDTSKTLINEVCPAFLSNVECRAGKYRRFDGLCTNLEHPTWGAALSTFARLMPPAFADGMNSPRTSTTGGELPLSRIVSRTMHPDDGFHDHAGTVMVIAWGQFMDHDYTLTATPLDPMNRNDPEECCNRPPHLKNPYCNEIIIPEDDYFYRLFNVRCQDFVRAFPGVRPGCRLGSRTPFNLLTGVLDGNTVYGIREEFARKLRSGYGGKLRMNPVFSEYGLKDLLPLKLDIPDEGCTRPNKSMYCFEAGEIRVNEQLVLTCMHTLMAREHNRIASALAEVNPHWDDETLYQEARRITIAEIQHVTYNEFLPIILGKDVMEKFGLLLEKHGYWDGHDSNVNPGVIDAFAAAAFRFGHSLLPTAVERWSKAHKFIASKRLSDLIRRPYDLYRAGVIDEYFMGLMNQVAQAMDDSITQEVTNHLFKKVGARFGMDLVSFNMQRGREFGIPSYMEFRKLCGLPEASSFEELFGTMPNETIRRYSSIFHHPGDVDLWSGGVSERPLPGSMLGPTFACVIATQFSNSRRGDRFWYELPNQPSSFTPEQLNEVRKARLARLICDNTDLIDTIQLYPMVLPDHEINPRVPCRTGVIPTMDFSKWAEFPSTSHAAQYQLSPGVPPSVHATSSSNYINRAFQIFLNSIGKKKKTRSTWLKPYILKIRGRKSPIPFKSPIPLASNPYKSVLPGLFYPEIPKNTVSASWKFSDKLKNPRYMKSKLLRRLKRSATSSDPNSRKNPKNPVNSRITKRYSNVELVGIKPDNLYRHPELSVEDQSRNFHFDSKKTFARTPEPIDSSRRLVSANERKPITILPSLKVSSQLKKPFYTKVVDDQNSTVSASEVADLNIVTKPRKKYTNRIVVPDTHLPSVNDETQKLPQETKESNGTYVNLRDHQTLIEKSLKDYSSSDIPPYNPMNIPYVDVPDYSDRQEESLDIKDRITKDKSKNDNDLDNDAVDPGTLADEEGEKSLSFGKSESQTSKEKPDKITRIGNYSDIKNLRDRNYYKKNEEGIKVDERLEEEEADDSTDEDKDPSEANIDAKNTTESAENYEADFNIEDYGNPFDLDKFIDELFHRDDRKKTEESRIREKRPNSGESNRSADSDESHYADSYHSDDDDEVYENSGSGEASGEYYVGHEDKKKPIISKNRFGYEDKDSSHYGSGDKSESEEDEHGYESKHEPRFKKPLGESKERGPEDSSKDNATSTRRPPMSEDDFLSRHFTNDVIKKFKEHNPPREAGEARGNSNGSEIEDAPVEETKKGEHRPGKYHEYWTLEYGSPTNSRNKGNS